MITEAVTKGLNPDVPMKDSGVEWVGEIPEGWEVMKIKWAAKMESGHTPNKKVIEYWTDCNIPWVSLRDTGHLRENDYIYDTEVHINELGLANSSARILPKDSVLFTRDATIGLCAITLQPMAVSQHIIAWICRSKLLPKYLLFAFYSMEPELNRLTMGSTIKTIGMPNVNELTTPIPSLPEQHEITAYLDKKCNAIDEAVSGKEKLIEKLEEYKKSLIYEAVTGKIEVPEECGVN